MVRVQTITRYVLAAIAVAVLVIVDISEIPEGIKRWKEMVPLMPDIDAEHIRRLFQTLAIIAVVLIIVPLLIRKRASELSRVDEVKMLLRRTARSAPWPWSPAFWRAKRTVRWREYALTILRRTIKGSEPSDFDSITRNVGKDYEAVYRGRAFLHALASRLADEDIRRYPF